ncbi:MAG: phosphorylase [Cyanobacteria bacterium P01_G01_bin.67]
MTPTPKINPTLTIDTIIVPQGAEFQAVIRGLQQCDLNTIEIISVPIGTSALQETLAGCAAKLSKAKQVLLMGLCGSLSKKYSPGDSVVIASCLNQLNHQVDLNLELTTKIKNVLSVDGVISLTSDHIIAQATEKRKLSQQYAASIVEMEGYDYATQLQKQGISVAMVRVVSDDLTGDIPDLGQVVDPQGNLQTIPMAFALLKQPRAAMRLIKGSLIGLKALEQATIKLFSR